jgi:hypothetical protein
MMYRYMHTVRLYNSSDEADVRPASNVEPQSEMRSQLDYATWYERLRGATANRPEASSPASVYQLDYAMWQSLLQPANSRADRLTPVAPVVDFISPVEQAQPDQQAA